MPVDPAPGASVGGAFAAAIGPISAQVPLTMVGLATQRMGTTSPVQPGQACG